jgi:hypothetical protein
VRDDLLLRRDGEDAIGDLRAGLRERRRVGGRNVKGSVVETIAAEESPTAVDQRAYAVAGRRHIGGVAHVAVADRDVFLAERPELNVRIVSAGFTRGIEYARGARRVTSR